MKEYGGRIAFRIFGVSALCLSLIHFFVQKFLDTFAARHGKTMQDTNSHTNGALGSGDKNTNHVEHVQTIT